MSSRSFQTKHTMETIEEKIKELNDSFHEYNPQKDFLNLNIYFTPLSIQIKKSSEIKEIFDKVKSKIGKILNIDVYPQFSTIPSNVPNSLTILEQKLHESYKQEPENKFTDTLNAQMAIMKYSFISPLNQKLIDYILFLGLAEEKGIHLILHEFEDYSPNKVHGAATVGGHYAFATISRPNKKLLKNILHEIFHCLGAKHVSSPFGIMYPAADSIFSNSMYLDPLSKKRIKKTLNKFL